MQSKPVNQKRGPTTGNANPGGKRDEFLTAKKLFKHGKQSKGNMEEPEANS